MVNKWNPAIIGEELEALKASTSAGIKANADDIEALETEAEALEDKIEALGSYSTTEFDTGKKWIDNSPIYSKTFYIESLPNSTSTSFTHGITNLGIIVGWQGFAQVGTNVSGRPIPSSNTLLCTVTNTEIRIITTSDLSAQSGYITMEYTKIVPGALTSPTPDTRTIEESEDIPEDISEEIPEENNK